MRIDVFLDGAEQPFESIVPPQTFRLDTSTLNDGQHELRFVATDEDGVSSERRMRINVQNGPAIAVHGIVDGDTVKGEISVLANAYGSKVGDEFEPTRIETPAPIPTWAWVLSLCIFAWGAGYISLELHQRDALPMIAVAPAEVPQIAGNAASQAEWGELGAQVYGNTCSSCHQLSGSGLPGLFPPLAGNSAVRNADPTDHIVAIINGVNGKTIDGVLYPAPMPPFGGILSDEDIAAVVNHERTQWRNNAPLVNASDISSLRN